MAKIKIKRTITDEAAFALPGDATEFAYDALQRAGTDSGVTVQILAGGSDWPNPDRRFRVSVTYTVQNPTEPPGVMTILNAVQSELGPYQAVATSAPITPEEFGREIRERADQLVQEASSPHTAADLD